MLASSGLCNHALFAHAQGQKRLPQSIVDLMGTGVIQILTLQPDPGSAVTAAVMGCEPLSFIERCGPAYVVAQQAVEL
ncbi:MAG: Uncharacterised protein [Synechococcus sp. MIT S9220]|nr:MAG: Uncharacterised protein [Synechococcus sp. MIT S9220]